MGVKKIGFTWDNNISDEVNKIIKAAIADSALDLKSESAKQAPKKYGDLEDNCNVSEWKSHGSEQYLTVGYDLPYARRQHEGYFKHPLKGKRKFLEDPYRDNEKRYFAYVIKKIKAYLGK